MNAHAAHLRRLMACSGKTLQQVVLATGVSEGTVKALLSGRGKPQARTLYRLAEGLNVSADEFFQPNPGEPQERARNIADLDLHHKIAQLLTSEEGDLLVELVQVLYNHSTRQRRCGYPR